MWSRIHYHDSIRFRRTWFDFALIELAEHDPFSRTAKYTMTLFTPNITWCTTCGCLCELCLFSLLQFTCYSVSWNCPNYSKITNSWHLSCDNKHFNHWWHIRRTESPSIRWICMLFTPTMNLVGNLFIIFLDQLEYYSGHLQTLCGLCISMKFHQV